MKYRATIPGTENVLIGDYWNEEAQVLSVPLPDGRDWTVTFRKSDNWVAEPIIELPKKRDALIRIGNDAYWRWDPSDGPKTNAPWIDMYASYWSDDTVTKRATAAGGFTVIFEGIDDPA
jgi:hypothetical protein